MTEPQARELRSCGAEDEEREVKRGDEVCLNADRAGVSIYSTLRA